MFHTGDLVRVGARTGIVARVHADSDVDAPVDAHPGKYSHLPLAPGGFLLAPLDGAAHVPVDPASIPPQHCSLIDRPLSTGDIVRLASDLQSTQLQQSGVAERVTVSATLQHVLTGTIIPAKFDCSTLSFVHRFEEGMLVTRENWIGVITRIIDKAALLFASKDAICVLKNSEDIDFCDGMDDDSMFAMARLAPGQRVKSTTAANLREGMWIRGSYFNGCRDEVATVVGVMSVKAHVRWHLFNPLLETTAVGLSPPSEKISTSQLTPLVSVFEPQTLQAGDVVFLKDESEAKTILNLAPDDSMETCPYKFALRIIETKTVADVCWQDASITPEISSTSLSPLLFPDENDFWPTDFVVLATSEDPDDDRIGFVISTKYRERTVVVRWFSKDMERLEGEEIEYSSFEIKMHPTLQFRVGDNVILTKTVTEAKEKDWFAEIVEIRRSDGRIKLRFVESGTYAICSPNALIMYKSLEDDADEVTDSESDGEEFIENFGDDNWVTEENASVKSDDDSSWLTENEDDLMDVDEQISSNPKAGQCEPEGDTIAFEKGTKSEENSSSAESEWVNFKTLDNAPENHKFHRPAQSYNLLMKSLPNGIIVRVYDDRIDLMRILLIGPDSTPYEGCLFKFDICLPQDFPNVPPLVHFHSHTFGMGRINPNLYEDGKVCLSLLGTWSGTPTESWSPKTSTLLQLFISIQSLVLTRCPYYNEPGFEKQINTMEGTANARMYNERVYLIVLRCVERWVSGGMGDEFSAEVEYHFHGMKWLRRVLERAREVAARSKLIGTSDTIDAGLVADVGFPIVTVSQGCLKLLQQRIDSLERYEKPSHE
ncbi:hypothetical protein HDU83_008827 [Entophlyctis luteolus]|nr:hypothetical protein HDU83_008827 [Entophlyctis luteolus]